MGERLCEECDQPMLPPGEVKRPNEYDHARGCPLACDHTEPGTCDGCRAIERELVDLRDATPPEDDASLDSPPFTPAALTEFAARGYERVLDLEDDASREARAWLDEWDSGEWVEERVSTLLPSLTEFLRDRVRAAERRGYERALEEAERECHEEALRWDAAGKGPAAVASDVHRAAGAVLCVRRLRALRERAGGSK